MKTLIKELADLNEEIDKIKNNGVNLEARDFLGRTALMHAVKSGNKNIVNLLVTNGANTETMDENGKTVLMYAEEERNKNIIEILNRR